MDASAIETIKDQNVRIEAKSGGTHLLVLEFAGVLSHRDPGLLLQPFFNEVHKRMTSDGGREVRVDIRDLRFMNSASFKHFVTWIRQNGSLPPAQRYKIHFLLNPQHHWQEVSIHALSCFSMDEITVDKAAVPAKK